jgi:anti-sigma factor RsiW
MRHEEARALAGAYLDGEADPLARAELEAHLAGCPACRQAVETERGFSAALRAEAEYFEAPEGLAARLAAAAAAAAPATVAPLPPAPVAARPRRAWQRSPALALAASLALVAVLSGGIGYYAGLGAPPGGGGLVEAVVDSHIRSLQAEHLTDVASTDQHTVKPWFDGRLDAAPPVRDLAAEGFPLLGGRLDYLDGRPVAALVYRHAKHLINLLVWPHQADTARPDLATQRRGYNVRHWQAGDLDYWLVSDLEMDQLAQLEALLRRP